MLEVVLIGVIAVIWAATTPVGFQNPPHGV
jgi:hypothetical protein